MAAMAYDQALAARIRALLGDEPSLTEQRMFGGLAFLIDGNMAVAASGQGGLLVRADPARADQLMAAGARPMIMRGREMTGWLRIEADALGSPEHLDRWVRTGTHYARSLPPKPKSIRAG
jgi:TfoX/Sxy family transcriptional regulator of competence genes